MAVKSLADGHLKLTILTVKPANPLAPTLAELIAGTDISCAVLASDFTWSAADSDKVNEKALCTTNNANAIGASNFQAGLTIFRYFDDTTGAVDVTADVAFQTLKAKGTTVYGYLREDGKLSADAWAAADEATYLEVLTDNPQRPQNAGGYIKRRIPLEPQDGGEATVAAA
ncbi:phage tail tube protein [Nocardioides sp. T2.26MG-1]|uniref:phage tail tube protein n=1 Tax=Nocardioides sp. T2.26MG-1 TaxID=3041166 RepID=UPI002477974B|nr:hypothetical protein [Nocardioides sp. T2.26MG-1]CAI9417376.1 hypothetical protein HIDPHFAB_03004 [Nocardioides sp. T2.26MG-1]